MDVLVGAKIAALSTDSSNLPNTFHFSIQVNNSVAHLTLIQHMFGYSCFLWLLALTQPWLQIFWGSGWRLCELGSRSCSSGSRSPSLIFGIAQCSLTVAWSLGVFQWDLRCLGGQQDVQDTWLLPSPSQPSFWL